MSSTALSAETVTAPLPPETWRKRYPALARFSRSGVSVVSLLVILLILGTAIFGPMIQGIDPTASDEALMGMPELPSLAHPAGTDFLGRDLLSRLMLGARISLAVGFVSMAINLMIGVGIGTIAGWVGGKVDTVLMRIVDALYSIPLLLIVILLQVFVKPLIDARVPPDVELPILLTPDLISVYLALGLSNWLTMARLARSEVINQSKKDYVAACESLGTSQARILIRHVLPNCMAPLLVAATLAIPEAIFVEAFLAFIGLGISPPLASWGSLASDAVQSMNSSPHLLIFPSIAISVTMLAFNLFGDGLRDAFDPRGSR